MIVPLSALFVGSVVWETFAAALSEPANLLWLALAGLTFGFCYVSWYKSFPLIGVGRGQAIADLYGLFASSSSPCSRSSCRRSTSSSAA